MWATVPSQCRCCATSRRTLVTFTASTISSCSFIQTRSASCWTKPAVRRPGWRPSARRAWRDALAEREELDRTEQEKLRLADLWAMQCKEIEAPGLQPGEDGRLE